MSDAQRTVDQWYSKWHKVDGGEKADLVRRVEELVERVRIEAAKNGQ